MFNISQYSRQPWACTGPPPGTKSSVCLCVWQVLDGGELEQSLACLGTPTPCFKASVSKSLRTDVFGVSLAQDTCTARGLGDLQSTEAGDLPPAWEGR